MDADKSKSHLERLLGQSTAAMFSSLAGCGLIGLAFVFRFFSVPFLKEMGTEEFNFALGCGTALIVASMIFELTIIFMLVRRAPLTS